MNISRLKKGMVTICSALVITTGSFTQPNPDAYKNDEIASMIRLEAMMSGTEQSIRFVAPQAEVADAQERLDDLAGMTEASLKYEAPSIEEAAEIAPELERLDKLADLTESMVKYEAPALEPDEVTPELERLDLLAARIETDIAFRAPEVMDIPGSDNYDDNSNGILLANKIK